MPKRITVHLKEDGTPECVPIVTHVRPGGSLIWGGKKHTGVFDGRVAGPLRDHFTLADLHAIHPIPGTLPFQPSTWQVIDESPRRQQSIYRARGCESRIRRDVPVQHHGVEYTLDPIIIVDNTASETKGASCVVAGKRREPVRLHRHSRAPQQISDRLFYIIPSLT